MSRLKLFGIGIPAVIGLLRRLVAQSYWERMQLFLHGGDFGITDPQFGMDLGFYAFDLPFYRLVLGYLFVAIVPGVHREPVGPLPVRRHPAGRPHRRAEPVGAHPAGRAGRHAGAAQGVRLLVRPLRAAVSNTRSGKPFTGAGYTDINAVLPAKLILMAIALICAAAVFSALVLRDLRIPGDRRVLLLLSSLIVGAGWPLVVEQISVKPNAAQKESEYISRSIAATRQAYGLTDKTVTYRDYSGNAPATAQQVAADRATTSNIRLLDPTIVSPAFTQFQQGKNFYFFPDQLSIDRYNGPDGNLRDYVVAARELNPDRLIDNQRDWINRHFVYTHGNGFIASPANTVRGVANDPNQNGGYPEFLASVVGANGSVVSPGPAPLDQPRVYFGPVIAGTAADYAIVGKSGNDREYDYETNTETKNYTYGGSGGVPIGNWLNRAVFAAKFSERKLPVPQPDRAEQQDPVQPRSVRARQGGGAVADRRHQRVPGHRQQADGVDRRRLHHAGQLPVLGADVAVERHRRLHRGGVQPARAGQAGVLHPQLGEGHRRRLRRHGDAVRTGRDRIRCCRRG